MCVCVYVVLHVPHLFFVFWDTFVADLHDVH